MLVIPKKYIQCSPKIEIIAPNTNIYIMNKYYIQTHYLWSEVVNGLLDM